MNTSLVSYDPSAAVPLLAQGRLAELQPRLEAARDETLNDVELWQSGDLVPAKKQPLDAGFIQ